MQISPSLPEPERTSRKSALLAPVVVLALLITASVVGLKSIQARSATGNLIFHKTESGWQQLPALRGFAETLRVSSNGTVWVSTLAPSGLSRWDGAAWRHYRNTDFGTRTSRVYGFTIDGEQVWAPTDGGVLQWDGQSWRCYREAATGPGASIVAGGGQVWVIDRSGNFSHFDGGRWQSDKLALPGMNSKEKTFRRSPKLARTNDGAVWLEWKGVWRWDRANWAPVTAGGEDLANALMIGEAGDRLWFLDSSGLRSVTVDGKDWAVYPSERTGLAKGVMVNDVASSGGHAWFATDTGLFEFDGSLFSRLPLPKRGVAGLRSVAASPDGTLWFVGLPPPLPLRTLQYLVPLTILMPLAIIGVIVWFFWRLRRRRLQQHQRVSQAVQYATGEIPEELQQGERRLASSWVTTTVLVIGTMVGFGILRSVWPKAPWWTVPIIGLAIELAIAFRKSLVTRKPKPSDPIGPGAPSRYDWGKTWSALAGAAFIVLLWNADRLPMLKFLRGYGFWLLLLVPASYNALMVFLMNRATRRADYDGALKVIRWFHFYNPSGVEPLRMSGHILLLAGRYREAEDTLRRSMASAQARESYGVALEYLGDALMEQGRYDEARRSYEAAVHAFSWMRRPYRGMAEMLLRQGNNSEQALKYVETIIDFSDLSWRKRQANGRPQDDYWALKAWALARLGRASEVAPAIENALNATDKQCLPDLATTHYRAGMAMLTLDNQSSASQHFKQALDLDPHGRRGTLAKAALQEGRVWERVRI